MPLYVVPARLATEGSLLQRKAAARTPPSYIVDLVPRSGMLYPPLGGLPPLSAEKTTTVLSEKPLSSITWNIFCTRLSVTRTIAQYILRSSSEISEHAGSCSMPAGASSGECTVCIALKM